MSTLNPEYMNSFQSRLCRLEIKISSQKTKAAQAINKRLNPPPKSSDLTNLSRANPQTGSFFVGRLPFDIRLMIYELLVKDIGPKLHIDSRRSDDSEKARKRTCQPCLSSDDAHMRYDHGRSRKDQATSWGFTHSDCNDAAQTTGKAVAELKTFFALAYSCHLVYLEAIRVLYSTVSFSFIHLHSIHHFLSATPIHQLHLIRSIQLNWTVTEALYFIKGKFYFSPDNYPVRRGQVDNFIYARSEEKMWEQTCQILSKLPSLSDLRIIFYQMWLFIREREMLASLYQITTPSTFVVQIPWKAPTSEDVREDENCPFRIDREPTDYDAIMMQFSPRGYIL